MKSTVTSKGQTTIPKSIRDRLKLSQGAELDWTLDDGHQIMVVRLPKPAGNPFQAALGAFPLPESQAVAELMLELRGEPDEFNRAGPGARVVDLETFLRANQA